MELISGSDLSAAASLLDSPEAPADVARLLAYDRVISAFHSRRTVIPLRYGAILPTREAVLTLLAGRRAGFLATLGRLDGMAEMGVRIRCPSLPAPPLAATPGAGYLAAARRRHAAFLLAPGEILLADRIAAALSGCYADQRREVRPAAEGRLLSLDFLVPRASTESFRKRAACLGMAECLLTGPWPPYHFAAGEARHA